MLKQMGYARTGEVIGSLYIERTNQGRMLKQMGYAWTGGTPAVTIGCYGGLMDIEPVTQTRTEGTTRI